MKLCTRIGDLTSRIRSRMFLSLLLVLAGMPVAAGPTAPPMPSTFNTTIGDALLCLDALDPAYFYQYLQTWFGAPYQHSGGGWWFRTPSNAKLWNVRITSIIVSDNTANLRFIAAETDVSTDKLAQAIHDAAGLVYQPGNPGKWPLLVSNTGSTIAWEQDKSKIYCAKNRLLFNPQ